MTLPEAAKKFKKTRQRVQQVIKRIPGAKLIKKTRMVWYIPDDAKYPEPLKRGPKN